ncbi:MAG: hypothetical protein ACXQTD_07445 [Candidatus Syntropharchaeia archaeon]
MSYVRETAIAGIAVIEAIALIQGIDGVILSMVIAVIAGIAGYSVSIVKEKRR